jgi:hypothetical protein
MKIMNKNKFVYAILSAILVLGPVACKDQLDVGNPNAPNFVNNVINEAGITAFAQGSTYLNGFKNGNDWLGNTYFSLPWGYAELMADNVGASASNQQITTMGQPDYIILDNGTKVTNNSPQVSIIRQYNTRSATGAGNNALYYQWLTMYAMNNAQNATLNKLDGIKFTGDAATKANTVKAWCYWWKGYAYAAIGSMYISGLIMDEYDAFYNVSKVNGDYVPSSAVIARSDYYYNQALTTLGTITSTTDYKAVLGELIPQTNQVGLGGVLSVAEWTRNINTMLARNILVNKLSPFVNDNLNATITKSSTVPMTAADWTKVINYTANGIQKGDHIFTVRSSQNNSIFSPTTGTVAALTANKPSSSTFKISERFVANFNGIPKTGTITAAGPHITSVLGVGTKFKTELSIGDIIKEGNGMLLGAVDTIKDDTHLVLTTNGMDSVAVATPYIGVDSRFSNNFAPSAGYKGDYIYTTAYTLVTGGKGTKDVQVLADKSIGNYEVVMAGSYEENALMAAEAKIRTGSDVDGGVALINDVRNYFGAGLADLPTGMSQVAAMQELVKERRVSLIFRGLSYYDSRRWGWTYDVSQGGGVYHQYVKYHSTVNTNVTISYNFMDYWDVPADESVLNAPSSSAAPVRNPNY